MQMSDRGPLTGHAAMIGSVSLYAVGLILQKQLVGSVPFPLIAFWQFGLAAVLLWTLTLSIAPRLKLKPANILAGLAWGMIAPGGSLMVNMIGARHTDGVTMMLIWGLLPLVAPLIGPLVIGERFRPIILLAATVAIAGVWLGVGDRAALGWSSIDGALLVAVAVIMAGSGFVLGRWLNRGGGPWHRYAALQVSGAALIALLFAALGPSLSPAPFADPRSAAIMAYLVMGMTVLNFLVFNLALARIPVAWASIYTALNAPIGAIAAFVLLGDEIRGRDALMILIVTVSVALPHYVEWRNGRTAQR